MESFLVERPIQVHINGLPFILERGAGVTGDRGNWELIKKDAKPIRVIKERTVKGVIEKYEEPQ